MKRRLLKHVIKAARKPGIAAPGPLTRLASRIAGIIYPTNNSGNSASVR